MSGRRRGASPFATVLLMRQTYERPFLRVYSRRFPPLGEGINAGSRAKVLLFLQQTDQLFASRSRTIIMVDDSCPIRVERSTRHPSLSLAFEILSDDRARRGGKRPTNQPSNHPLLGLFAALFIAFAESSLHRGLYVCGFAVNLANIIGLSLSLSPLP